ncbi:MAG: hypothetical protein HQL95_06145 [Magnetococcales bacterium]|nr:hypothetical protein [Magnetococcales bacterium]
MPTTSDLSLTPSQKKALQAILEKRPVRIHLAILSTLKSRGWIQLAMNDASMGTATSYDLTPTGRETLGVRDPGSTVRSASTIGLEAEICEECGGSGQLFVLDGNEISDPCPWCQGTGRITSMLEEN